jgi:hypothetical protein
MKRSRIVKAMLIGGCLGLLPLFSAVNTLGASAENEAVVLDSPIAAENDDAEQRAGSGEMKLNSSDLEMTKASSTQVVGLRFTNITVPRGSTITASWVQFRADEDNSRNTTLNINGQAANNASTFIDNDFNISSRARTENSVVWMPVPWEDEGAEGPDQRTPSLNLVLSEIINRPGWQSGNALAIIISGLGKRVADSFEGNHPPVLHIEYTSDGTTTTTTVPPTTTEPPTSTTAVPPPTSTTIPPTTTTVPPPPTSTTTTTTTIPPSGGSIPTGASYGFPNCFAVSRNIVDVPDRTSDAVWSVNAPPDNTTYDLRGVTVTNQPSSSYPFSYGRGNDGGDAALNTCVIGGNLRDDFGPINPGSPYTWRFVHDTYNAACVKGIGVNTHQVIGIDCRGIEDGFRPQEDQSGSTLTPNNAVFLLEDTYLDNVLDDCLENDYISEGVVLDSLWDGCVNGISERPSGDRCWVTPPDETLVVDHLLMGLRPIETEVGWGYGRLFKFAKCAADGQPRTHNNLVIKCSTFFVPDYREDGGTSGGAMDIPAGTTVDDSDCPNSPTTIVWLGGGNTYPGNLRGLPIRTVTTRAYWDNKVAAWHARH